MDDKKMAHVVKGDVDEDVELLLDEELETAGSDTTFDNDRLERCGRWLLSIPRDDILALQQTAEYHEFLRAFDRLGHVHRKVICLKNLDLSQVQEGSFLQHLAVDDVILRVFEFLECQSLSRTSITCSRFHGLANLSAKQRTQSEASGRQLNNVMKLLRAKEQMQGVAGNRPHVRVPMLGLSRIVLVRNCGDPEYNGVYFCTGCNGNGFVFTKPRHPEQRIASRGPPRLAQQQPPPVDLVDEDDPPVAAAHPLEEEGIVVSEEDSRPGQLLRCCISRRFSNENILWYMSKEIETISEETSVGEITQVYSFWAKLTVAGEAPSDECRYPSQTAILSRDGEPAWQALAGVGEGTEPPFVELLE